MDVLLASSGLGITAPLWILAGAAVRLTSRGPILYAARRVGLHGKVFSMYKFRTMRLDTGGNASTITAAGDPRITHVGRVLRATKIDELPQLINVLRGEMSLVGPRPEAPEFVSLADPRQREILSVRPGITGPSQLAHRHEEQELDYSRVEEQYRTEILPRKVESDLRYVRNRSLWRDLRLIMTTVRRLFS
jgi:lipopolysaccharide/colanic/teichoic acid biosynthesis glycosyltransferase